LIIDQNPDMHNTGNFKGQILSESETSSVLIENPFHKRIFEDKKQSVDPYEHGVIQLQRGESSPEISDTENISGNLPFSS
jgi:hypothetical protein